VAEARAAGARVAVVAVDPSSPFSGGAILGDRIRMERHTGDAGAYVRSLSARGRVGGVSAACAEVVDLLDAVGFDRILVETVGVGQSELAVMEVADTVAVLLTPESGDAVQAMKAGLLEIADLFVVNMADRPGADSLARILRLAVALDEGEGWVPPVHLAVATAAEGLAAILASAADHRAWCAGPGRGGWDERRARGRMRQFLDLAADEARTAAGAALDGALGADLRSGRLDPRAAFAAWSGR
jgi:LAO/AO transport system kinase